MPTAWLVLCSLTVVVLFAEAASVLWIIGIEAEFDEFFAGPGVVVGYCADGYLAEDADGVSGEYGCAECAVSGCVVSAVSAGAACPVGLTLMLRASAGLAVIDGGASVD